MAWVGAILRKAQTFVVDGLCWHWLPLLGSRRDLYHKSNIIAVLSEWRVELEVGVGGLGIQEG
jgi:hypothetical protein